MSDKAVNTPLVAQVIRLSTAPGEQLEPQLAWLDSADVKLWMPKLWMPVEGSLKKAMCRYSGGECRQGYATTLLSSVKRFVVDFLYTGKGRIARQEKVHLVRQKWSWK
jgi:hypothetical protein